MDKAPISPSGWKMTLFFYETQEYEPFMLRGAYSLSYCQRIKSTWHDERHDGKSEMLISPVDGWSSIKEDPFGAIAWAIAQDLVSVQRGAALIRAIADEVAGEHPIEGLLGLAVFYGRCAVEQAGADAKLARAVDGLSENLRRIIEDDGKPIPF